MRVLIKGGVWKNTEDEILKAAVMKYGKNQWARVASLLARKSAKQCKARWYEWLDPSIKKTEWSREEEEKLLHLAKLMPSQWRTIAPIVGRTAAQCMEHYEKLLDAAQSKDADASDDPRRLRPGEIDPNPENKPARPDPIDMDEDEKEMLSEARARLANTKGKKAKRKARETQLREAKRLASMQKRRELKAAGIDMDRSRDTGMLFQSNKKRKAFIDYVNEIPFEKKAPVGFYDVSHEKATAGGALDPKATALYLDKLEGARRDAEEKKNRRLDARRQKKLLSTALPAQIAAMNALNDPLPTIKRKRLELPAPMVSNDELSALAKQGAEDVAHAQMLALEHAAASQALLTSYEMTPQQATPARPAAASSSREALLQEAANQAALARAQTPLLGGENVELAAGTGYGGITPRTGLVKATPLPGSRTPQSALRTPMRDQLGINAEPLLGLDASRKAEKARVRGLAQELRAGFASLPSAEFAYELSLPEVAPDDDRDDAPEDAGDREARRVAQAAREAELAAKRRSSAVQRRLPRPLHADSRALAAVDGPAELRALLAHDIADAKKKKAPKLPEFSDDALHYARSQVALEAQLAGAAGGIDAAAWASLQDAHRWDPVAGAVVDASALPLDAQVRLLTADFSRLAEHHAKLAKKAAKLEHKGAILHGGYGNKCAELVTGLQATQAAWQLSERDRHCFAHLHGLETSALPLRLVKVAREVDALQLKEVELQKKFATLVAAKEAATSV
ncbi:cell division cycle 5-related protein [Achlya hypogyna]|uniref:Cell division cycle 5-related protein n=1 Tax=Achlya hypogyna TaxID=1202772 RepID=A0A1V9ZL04_ACHHY|nr:cell division cycle 5-related protein [Achlya hypogyna]